MKAPDASAMWPRTLFHRAAALSSPKGSLGFPRIDVPPVSFDWESTHASAHADSGDFDAEKYFCCFGRSRTIRCLLAAPFSGASWRANRMDGDLWIDEGHHRASTHVWGSPGPGKTGATQPASRVQALKGEVLNQLRRVTDPDLLKDIVSLGFVRGLDIDYDTGKVSFELRLTTPACPVKDDFVSQCKTHLLSLGWITEASALCSLRHLRHFRLSVPPRSPVPRRAACAKKRPEMEWAGEYKTVFADS